jgi:glycosyltransferase involved in cell wall biosynthesis
MKTYIIIPGYNEGEVIKDVIKDLFSKGYNNIVVVDDGSKDKTGEYAYEAGATVLTHIINRGQGAALKTGNDYALENDADIIVHFDADGQMQSKDIKAMIQPIINKKADITMGSRFLGKAENIDTGKKIALKLARVLVFLLYGLWLTDSQNGFRAVNRKAAQKIEITSNRMEHAGEILGEIRRRKLRYKEIPVHIKYTNYSMAKGQSWTRSFSLGTKMIIRKLLKK